MSEESAAPPKRTVGRSVSLPSSPFDLGDDGQGADLRPSPPPGRQLSRALSSHLDRCTSAQSYRAAARRQPASPAQGHSSVIAAALGTRARRFSFVDGEEEEVEPLAAPVEAAAAAALAAVSPAAGPSPSRKTATAAPRGGTVLEGATILFTAVASFPALSLPWATSTMGGWPGVAAVAVCGVATAFYSCWLVSFLVGYQRVEKKEEEEEAAKEKKEKGAAAAAAAAGVFSIKEEEQQEQEEEGDFRHARYHDVAACILGHRTASLFVTPVQVVVCFGICVRSFSVIFLFSGLEERKTHF
jgi:hypothetical protein